LDSVLKIESKDFQIQKGLAIYDLVIHEPHRKDLIHLQYYGPKEGIHQTAWLAEPNPSATNCEVKLRNKEPQTVTPAIDALHDGNVVELTRGQSNDAAWVFMKMGQRTSTQMKELAPFISLEDRKKQIDHQDICMGDLLGVPARYSSAPAPSSTASSEELDASIENDFENSDGVSDDESNNFYDVDDADADNENDCGKENALDAGDTENGVDDTNTGVDARGYPFTLYDDENRHKWERKDLEKECVTSSVS